MAEDSLRTTLVAIERRGWDALCDGTGGHFYGDLMTEDAVMVLVDGMILDRAAVVASLAQAPPWSSYRISDERVVTSGPDSAALVYLARASRAGDLVPFSAVMSSVYRRIGGRWRLCLYQQTATPDPADGS